MPWLKNVCRELSWASFVLGRRIKQKLWAIGRAVRVPRVPINPDGKVYLHLGCGGIVSPEFINVDVCPAPHIHYVRDVRDLSVFPDNHADLVYACHLLEHIGPAEVPKTLWEWRRVLKPGGVLRLSVPDFDKVISMYAACGRDIESIQGPLLGGWGSYKEHGMVFNVDSLRRILTDVGFASVREWDPAAVTHHQFDDWASRPVHWKGVSFPISLNVEAVK